ncbi:MAG: 5'-methylthioadenosine/S-adenosylhomocysteine nucleosidase [Mycoplasma sp.]
MLGIIIAMETECKELVKSSFKDIYIHSIHGHKFYVVKTISGDTAIVTFSGIGKSNAAATTALLINSFNVTACLNIGSAGIFNSLEIFDVLIIDKMKYLDVDLTAFGYEKGQIPKSPQFFSCDQNLIEISNNLLKASNYESMLGNCMTSDTFINKKNRSKFDFADVIVPTVIDMESASIAQICLKMKAPLISIKIGIDKLDSPIENEIQFNENLSRIQLMIDDIASNLINAITFKMKSQQK